MASLAQTAPHDPQAAQPQVRIHGRRYGGYPISRDVALEWANRIRAGQPGRRRLTADPRDAGNILLTLHHVVVAAGGIKCNYYGLRTPKGYQQYIIVTTEDEGRFVRVNGKMEPGQQLIEGEPEAVAKELLKQEGVQHDPFTTVYLS